MRILGIDPGTVITGIGIIEISGGKISLLHYDAVKLNSADSIHNRLKKIYDICELKIKKFKPEELAVESTFYGKNIQSTLKLGQAKGVAIITALNNNMNVSEYTPREIKKSVTGSGSASKRMVMNIIKSIFSIKEDPEFYDSSDALAVALCHFYSIGSNYNKIKTGKNSKLNRRQKWSQYVKNNPRKILYSK
ncbi:MAG: crossover junction endodeoxyribonuclease RuvC [Ignavibacteria bacterium]|nr:crossover junction endodeoxyribonuclease RuvC [Ignavibacteria bacterium]